MMTEEIQRLSDIEPEERCPKCHSPYLKRRSTYDSDVALWDLYERCSICKWSRTYVNVRVG